MLFFREEEKLLRDGWRKEERREVVHFCHRVRSKQDMYKCCLVGGGGEGGEEKEEEGNNKQDARCLSLLSR